MKKIGRTLALPLALLPLVLGSPAQAAADNFDIQGGVFGPFGPLAVAFEHGRCPDALVTSPFNGVEAKIVDARGYAARVTTLTWSATWDFAGSLGISDQIHVYNAGCTRTLVSAQTIGPRALRWSMPGDARWVVVQARAGSAQLRVSMSA